MARLLCPKCGNAFLQVAGANAVCPRCGYTAAAPTLAPTAAPARAGATFVAPEALPAMTPPATPVVNAGSNGMALAGGVLGITSAGLFLVGGVGIFSVFFFLPIVAILAVVFGAIGFARAVRPGQKGKGMAVTGVVLGGVVLFARFVLFGGFL